MSRPDEAARRQYWRDQLEAATAFLGQCMDYPVAECGEPLVPLPEAAAAANVRVRFSGTPIVGDLPRIFCLREGLLAPFLAAAKDMNRRGWVMLVEDGYRTREMQRSLGRKPAVFDTVLRRTVWEIGGGRPPLDLFMRRLTGMVATRPKIGTHMSGSAIDISVLEEDTGREVDRGGAYLEMSELTPMASPFVSAEARRNRDAITALMAHHGFVAYPYEFWHYNSGDAYASILNRTGRPGRYGAVDWNPSTRAVTAIADPCQPLHDPADIEAAVSAAFARMA